MAIVGINLTKISSEKTGELAGKISIQRNVVVKNVEEAKIGLSMKEKSLQVGFAYSCVFAPNIGKTEIEGKILMIEPEENAKMIIEGWKKSKKLPPMLVQQLFTTILRKCHIKALALSDDLGLPSPIKLPGVKVRKATPAEAQKLKKK